MTSNIKGPGLLYVTSKISRTDILDEETYMKWYDEDHIAEIVETSGMKSAFRYIDLAKSKVDKPYLAFYPLEDLVFTQGEEFKKIKVKSDILPGSGICYDLADIDVRYYGLVQKTEQSAGSGPANFLATIAVEPEDRSKDEEVETWYRTEQLEAVSKTKGYLRTTRYKLLYARTNAQSRALKGLPTTDEAPPEPPTWMAIHEFSSGDMLEEGLMAVVESSVARKALSGAKQVETPVYRLAKAFGDKKFFD